MMTVVAAPEGRTQDSAASWERSLIAALEERLGLSPGRLHDGLTLDQLRLDSIEIPGLLQQVKQIAGVDLEVGDVLAARTFGELATRIAVLSAEADAPREPSAAGARSAFSSHVNPHLARLLECLHLDRVYVRGEGLYLQDEQRREVLDFTAQFGALPFGYNPPEVWRALESCRERAVPSFAQPSVLGPAAELAERVIACAPTGLRYVTFANSGAEAVEVALKLCLARTGRRGILSAQGGFHGKTTGALSATGRHAYQAPFGLPYPDFETVPYDDPGALEARLAAEPQRYAAFLVEPIQGEAGVVVPHADYLARAREICRRHEVLLVIDEVQTGLGRTGRMFATPDDVEPDVLTVAKALGGGLIPIGACLCRAGVYSREFALKHSSTFAGSGLGAVVGLCVIDLLRNQARDLLGNVQRMGSLLLEGLRALGRRYRHLIADVRGQGLMLGVEFRDLRAESTDSLLGVASEQRQLALLAASYLLNVHGVRVAHSLSDGNVLRVQPALTVRAEHCGRFLAAFEATLSVLDSGSIARVYAPLLGLESPAAPARCPLKRRRPLARTGGDRPTFVMLYHPPDADSFKHLDPCCEQLPRAGRERLARDVVETIAPFVAARCRMVSRAGASADAVFVLLPHTAELLLGLGAAERTQLFESCVEMARAEGARVLGLGGYTSIVTNGGTALAGRGPVVTSGNGLTAVASVRALASACARSGTRLDTARVAILGAGGSIGRVATMLVARDAGSVLCLGNPAGGARAHARLQRVANELCERLLQWSDDPSIAGGDLLARVREWSEPTRRRGIAWLRERLCERGLLAVSLRVEELATAPCAIAAVSTPQPFVRREHLHPGALFCDVSRPRALAESVAQARPDIEVLEAGGLALPHSSDLPPLGLSRGQLYACMAEALLLTWEGVTRDYSLGADLSLDDVLQLERWAEKHGLRFV